MLGHLRTKRAHYYSKMISEKRNALSTSAQKAQERSLSGSLARLPNPNVCAHLQQGRGQAGSSLREITLLGRLGLELVHESAACGMHHAKASPGA